VGVEVPVLVEGPSPETDLRWTARLSTQAPEIDGAVLINDFEIAEPRAGEIRLLRVTEAHDYDVVGTLLPPTEPAPNLSAPGLVNITSLAPAPGPRPPAPASEASL
jgi:ribosomal protein S12 methylthiotransferase